VRNKLLLVINRGGDWRIRFTTKKEKKIAEAKEEN